MKLKIEIDTDIADQILLAIIKEQIGYVKQNIKPITKKLKQCQVEDIKNAKETLAALEHVYEYFGGNFK